MLSMNMVIADEDKKYVDRLVSYLAEKNKQLNISSFSNKDSFYKYLRTSNAHLHILLFSESMCSEEIDKKYSDVKMILSEGMITSDSPYQTINKYQRADDMLNEILIAFSEATGMNNILGGDNGKTRVIALYSPVGGSGKTTIAIVAAKAMAAAGRSVLYLNFEGISSVSTVFKGLGTHSMSEVFLAAKTKNVNVGYKVIQCSEKHYETGIEFIGAPECAVEYSEMTAAELRRIVEQTKNLEHYDDIIIDMNSGYNDDIFETLSVCDVIMMPYRKNRTSIIKMNDFATALEKLEKLELLGGRIVPIENCSNGISCESFSGIYVRTYVPEMAVLNNIDNILYGDSRKAAEKLIAVLG